MFTSVISKSNFTSFLNFISCLFKFKVFENWLSSLIFQDGWWRETRYRLYLWVHGCCQGGHQSKIHEWGGQVYAFWDIIDERWDRQLHSPLHDAGYFLNPTYFYDKTRFSEDGEVGRGLMTCIERMHSDPEIQSCIITQLQDYRAPSKLFSYSCAIHERTRMLSGILFVYVL